MGKLNPEGMVRSFFKRLPKMPQGEIDYSRSNAAVVVTVFVKYKKNVLLVKRSNKVSGYRGKWNAISGYVDEVRPIKEIALKEAKEEIGISEDNILRLKKSKVYSFRDRATGKRWVVCPYTVETKRKPTIRLDWENTEFKWILPSEIEKFDTVPNLKKSLGNSIAP